MIFITNPKAPKKISDVCLELNKRLFLAHDLLKEFKFNLAGSNFDGNDLSREITRTGSDFPDVVVSTKGWMLAPGESNGHEIILSNWLVDKMESDNIAHIIGTLVPCILDMNSAHWIDKEINVFDRRVPSPYTVMGDVFRRIYKQEARKGVHDYGAEFRGEIEQATSHVID